MLAFQLLQWFFWGLAITIAAPVLYLWLVSISALLTARRQKDRGLSSSPPSRYTHFAILVPAHNEIAVLGNLLDSLNALEYPKAHFSVHVVADNCTDATADLARATGWAHVHERFDAEKRGKGYALSWLLKDLEDRQLIYDAYVVLDADSAVDSTFLLTMNSLLLQGARALQARYTVLNATESPSTALRWFALSLINYVRPLGRTGLGGSSTLTGNGMCFSRELLQQNPWQAFSLTEDYQYYLTLVQRGERVRFVPEATVRSVMPVSFTSQRTQDIRWEANQGGQPQWKSACRLLMAGVKKRDLVRLEAMAELITPPLSILVGCCLLTLISSLLLWSLPPLLMSLLIIAGLTFYISTPMFLLRPPRVVYMALLHAPGFMLWKIWVLLVMRKSKKHTGEWVRTSRGLS